MYFYVKVVNILVQALLLLRLAGDILPPLLRKDGLEELVWTNTFWGHWYLCIVYLVIGHPQVLEATYGQIPLAIELAAPIVSLLLSNITILPYAVDSFISTLAETYVMFTMYICSNSTLRQQHMFEYSTQ